MNPNVHHSTITIAKTWKQPKCPSTKEWIKKMWYRYKMDYYSAIKWNKIGSFVEMRMDLKSVIWSEVSQKQKNGHRLLTYICGSQKSGIDDLICKAEIEIQLQRTNILIPMGKVEGGMNWNIGIDTYTLLILYIKQITNINT